MRSAFIAITVLSVAAPAMASEWDRMDKTLVGVLIASKAVDCMQTRYIFHDPEWHEVNPVIREGVDGYGKGFIPTYFVITTLAAAFIADWLPSDYRKAWLGFWVGMSVTTVHKNYVAGIKLRW